MGCKHIPIKTGTRFTRLTVTSQDVTYTKKGEYKYHCVCDCGKEGYYASSKLRTGHTKSCGCLRKDMRRVVKLETMLNKNIDLSDVEKIWIVKTKKELDNLTIIEPA